MSLTHRLRRLAAVALLIAAPLLTAGCASTVSATSDDATITARVKTILLNDQAGSLWKVDVETFNGVVTLSGAVASADERDRAIALARKANGVVDVKSTLQVQPSSPAPR